ncbi:hypothetical protein SAMN06295885_2381 [Rathayibacter oskolensis]|uniref:Uncharacterized protein n=1 Tax=Rathayibacter oskolensis TaxID=1891671 RepID=A0A1X7P3X9_9MICO|nr:hypothetical protein [Rathayibacter oskolensis]SMH44537.1 hypothetical protein SAMN06295885_2381 [Rathayibacter oskolensis]
MILLRTHSNRWIARARRAGVALGLITFAADLPRPVFKTVRLEVETGERILLRDSDSLEEAFAVLIAGVERARLAAEQAPADETIPAAETPTATDPVEESIAA